MSWLIFQGSSDVIFLYLSIVKVKDFLLGAILLAGINCGSAQTNLVPNGGFEDTITCSSHVPNQLFALNWWMFNTVDYFRTAPFTFCANSGMAGSTPYNIAGYQVPHSGKTYVGVVTILSSSGMQYYREYIQAPLLDTLVSGKTYCVSLWYSQSNRTKYAIDRLGIYFSLGGINLAATSTFTPYIPQITTPSGQFLNDTLNWNQFKTSYLANGDENYITIGNFFDSVQTNKSLYPNSTSLYAESYYLFDDISIIPIDAQAYAGKDTSCCKGDSIYITNPGGIGFDNNTWSELVSGVQVGSGRGFWLKPDTSASYILAQDICGTISYDTIRVIVNCHVGIKPNEQGGFNVYPIPANERLQLGNIPEYSTVTIFSSIGVKFVKLNPQSTEIVNTQEWPDGIYMLQLRSANTLLNRTILVQH